MTFKQIVVRSLTIIAIICFFLLSVLPVKAQSLDELRRQQQEAAKKAREFRDQQAQKEKEARSFEEKIAQNQREINTLQGQISNTQNQIRTKEGEISTTAEDIAKREEELKKLHEEQNKFIAEIYMRGNDSIIQTVVQAESLSTVTDKRERDASINEYILGIIDEVNKRKAELAARKNDLEGQRNKLGELKNQQEAQRSNVTQLQNSNERFKQLAEQKAETFESLAEAEAEKQRFDKEIAARIAAARRGGGTDSLAKKGHVTKGQVIGYEGSTGYSTGPHLHWSVMDENGNYVNPRGQIGYFQWPLDSFYVSQEFGRPNWAAKYAFHNGIDMVSNDGAGAPVRAAADGDLVDIFHDNNCMPGGYGNYRVVLHPNNKVTIYGHLVGSC